MSGAIPPLPSTPSWRGAQLKHGENFTFFPLPLHKSRFSRRRREVMVVWDVTSCDWLGGWESKFRRPYCLHLQGWG